MLVAPAGHCRAPKRQQKGEDADMNHKIEDLTDEPEEHVFFPRNGVDWPKHYKKPIAERILLLSLRKDDGTLSLIETVVTGLEEICILEQSGTKRKYLAYVCLEGAPVEAFSRPTSFSTSKIEMARQFALAAIQTEQLITPEIVIRGVNGLARTEACKALVQLTKVGKLVRVGHGVYGHPERPAPTLEDVERLRGRKGRPITKRKKPT